MKKYLSGPASDGLFITVSGNNICVTGSPRFLYVNDAVIQNGKVVFENVQNLERAAELVFSMHGGRKEERVL